MTKRTATALWIPVTPGGTPAVHLASDTEDEAWEKLLEDAKHMPYDGKKGFQARGYKVLEYSDPGEN